MILNQKTRGPRAMILFTKDVRKKEDWKQFFGLSLETKQWLIKCGVRYQEWTVESHLKLRPGVYKCKRGDEAMAGSKVTFVIKMGMAKKCHKDEEKKQIW